MTSHFDESIITGTRAMSGSAAIRFRNLTIAAFESSIASSMLTSMICAPLATCWRATSTRAGVVAREDELRERARARDVRALADVDEQRIVVDVERLETGKSHDSGPHRRGAHRRLRLATGSGAVTFRGGSFATASPIARMCAGVVPQQPPTRLTKPLRAKSSIRRAVCAGVSS